MQTPALRRGLAMTITAVAAIGLAALGATPASAATAAYSAQFDGDSPLWTYSHPCEGQVGHFHSNVQYHAEVLRVDVAGDYTISRTTTQNADDGVLFLYGAGFDPANYQTSCLAFNDDAGSLEPALTVPLEADTEYVIVTSELTNTIPADRLPVVFTITVTGPGTPAFGTPIGVDVEQAADQADPTASPTITFTATFDEPVSGFDAADVDLAGTATASVTSVVGEGTTYAITVEATTPGTVDASVPAGVVTTAGGATNDASTSVDASVTFAPEAATISVEQADAQADPTSDDSFTFDIVASDPIEGLDASDLVIAGAAGATSVELSGEGASYVATVSGATQAGDVTLSVPAGAATGPYGLPTEASTSIDATVVYAPIVASPTPSAPAPSAPAPTTAAPAPSTAPDATLPQTGAEPAYLAAIAAAFVIGLGALVARRRSH